MKIPERLITFLNQSGVHYEVIHHPVAYTAQELAAIEGIKGRQHAKVVAVNIGGKLALAALSSDRRVDLARLGAVLATEMAIGQTFPDCEIGAMPPLGHLYGVETYVDRRLAENDRIVFEAGTHGDAIQMKYTDFERLARPQVAEFAMKL